MWSIGVYNCSTMVHESTSANSRFWLSSNKKKEWRNLKWDKEKNSIWKRSDNRKKAIEKNLHIFCSNLNGSNWFSTVQQKAFLSFCQDGEKNLLVAASMLQKPIQCLNGWMFEWSNVWLVECSNVWMFKRLNAQMFNCLNGSVLECLDGLMIFFCLFL